MTEQPEKPDFIVDASGTVWDVRHSTYSSSSSQNSTPQLPEHRTGIRSTYRYTPYIIPIPIGLCITLLVLVMRLGSPATANVNAPDSSTLGNFNRGNSYFDKGDYDMAIIFFNMAISSKPDFGEAYNNRGLAYQAKGRNGGALADFDKAVQLMPNSATVYSNRGHAYIDLDNFEMALADFDKAIELDPKFAKAYYNRGLARLKLKHYNAAISDFDKAIQLTPENTSSMMRRTSATVDSLTKRLINNIKNTQSYADLPLAYTNRGNAYLGLGYFNQACADFDQAIQLQPNFALAYYNRGLAYYFTGDLNQSIADFKKVLALNNDPEVVHEAEVRLSELGIKLKSD